MFAPVVRISPLPVTVLLTFGYNTCLCLTTDLWPTLPNDHFQKSTVPANYEQYRIMGSQNLASVSMRREVVLRWGFALWFTRYSGCAGRGAVLVVGLQCVARSVRLRRTKVSRRYLLWGPVATLGGARPTNGSDRGCARSNLIRWVSLP